MPHITHKNLKRVEFPVFLIPTDEHYSKDGLIFIEGRIVDDRNMPGETLGLRRIQTPFKKLLPLRRGVDSYIGIFKQKGNQAFIDSLGRIFRYEKTKMIPLKYHKIRKVVKEGTYSSVWVSNFSFPFVVPRPPKQGYIWAGVLHLNGQPWLLYDYAETKQRDTRRKI